MHHACAHFSRGRAARLARSAPKDAGLTSRGALPGPGSPTRVFGALGWKISRGGASWLVSAPPFVAKTRTLAVGPVARAIGQGFKNIGPIATMTLAGPETGLDFF